MFNCCYTSNFAGPVSVQSSLFPMSSYLLYLHYYCEVASFREWFIQYITLHKCVLPVIEYISS